MTVEVLYVTFLVLEGGRLEFGIGHTYLLYCIYYNDEMIH